MSESTLGSFDTAERGERFLATTYHSNGIPFPAQFEAENAVKILLRLMGRDPSESGVRDTPERVVRAITEMTAGERESPEAILGRVFEEDCDEMVILRGIPFVSLCEHHLLPFSGTADVGYIPGKVVGLSKLARLVDCFARRTQMQERLTKQIATALQTHLNARGVMVVVRGVHSCMCNRGVKKSGSEMITSVCLGMMKTSPEARQEFLALTK